MKTNYDVIVIGAGSGGLTAAVGLSKVGKSVLLVEREHLGGECTNSGCIPSKALLHHAKTYHSALTISGTNGNTENYRREGLTYVRSKIYAILEHETPEHFKRMGIDVVIGEAVFASPRIIRVNDATYTFKKVVIATGSSPRMITASGLDSSKILTNQNLFTQDSIPARTLIVGAGPIGLEMGQALAMLGSVVTILDNGPTFAKLEDSALQPIIKKSFADLGITIVPEATITRVEQNTAYVTQRTTDTLLTIPFDKVLVAIGRVSNLPQGLDAAKIDATEFGISVNRNYRTSNKQVYALGDVAGKFKFTHTADATARGVVTHIISRGLISITETSIPKVTYTSPEIAQVGLSQTEAEDIYGEQNIFRIEVPFTRNDRAVTDSATDGLLVVLVRRLSGKILGAHIVGPRAGEILAVFSVALDNNLSLWKLRRTIFAYPTYSLVIKKAGDVFFATQISTLKKDVARKVMLALPKLALIALWLGGLFFLYQYIQINNLSVETLAFTLFDLITQTAWGPLLYILAYTIRPITFFPGTALTILSGVFFGLWGGIIYTIIGANLSATVAYFIGRFFGGQTTSNSVGVFGRFATACRVQPFISILTMRLLFLPYDAVNYGAGFLKIPYIPYITATVVGCILGIATFVSLGASLSIDELKANGVTTDAINGSFLALSALIFVLSIGIAKLLKK